MSRQHFLQPLLRRSAGPMVLQNTRTGRVVASRIEAAFDSATRRRGLLGREGLEPGQALVIAPTSLVHTFAMRFSIDILFADRTGRVLKLRTSVPPRRIAGALGAFAVIEMAGGAVESSGTRAGDVLTVMAA